MDYSPNQKLESFGHLPLLNHKLSSDESLFAKSKLYSSTFRHFSPTCQLLSDISGIIGAITPL